MITHPDDLVYLPKKKRLIKIDVTGLSSRQMLKFFETCNREFSKGWFCTEEFCSNLKKKIRKADGH